MQCYLIFFAHSDVKWKFRRMVTIRWDMRYEFKFCIEMLVYLLIELVTILPNPCHIVSSKKVSPISNLYGYFSNDFNNSIFKLKTMYVKIFVYICCNLECKLRFWRSCHYKGIFLDWVCIYLYVVLGLRSWHLLLHDFLRLHFCMIF